MVDLKQQKQSIRQLLLTRRQALSERQLKVNSCAVIKHINNHILSQEKPLNCAIYLPFNNEIDLTELLSTNLGHRFFIPAIKGQNMQFQQHQPQLPTKTHHFGMQQPNFIDNHIEPKLNLCLMPLLGFDNNGNRLGMGGGFYDRYFAKHKDCQLIAVAHQCQHYPELPVDDWDIKPQQIITEQQVITP